MQFRSLVVAAMLCATLVACSSKNPSGALPDAPQLDATVPPAPDAFVCSAPMTTCGATCTNLATDANNCGACGHVCGCGSTTCTNGVCDSHVLAAAQDGPNTLALDSANGNLYWGNDANPSAGVMPNVLTMSTAAGSTASVLLAGRTAVRGFAFDATRIYLSRNAFNTIESDTLDGKTGGNFTNAQENGAAGIVSDGTHVYWANGSPGGADPASIRSAPNGAPVQTATTLAPGQVGADGVAIDATNVYWVTHNVSGSLMMIAKTGGTATQLAPKQANPHALVYANGFLYWTNQGDPATPDTGSVQRMEIATKTITTYASALPGPSGIAVDASFVYWTDPVAGSVMRAAIAGGSAAIPIVPHDVNGPTGLAISNACLYYTDYAADAAGAGSVRSHDLQ